MHCVKQKKSMILMKLTEESVLLNKLISKSPIMLLVLFSLDMLWRIRWMFSKALSRVLISGSPCITQIIVFLDRYPQFQIK